jgi:hypothetical protein
LLEVAEGRQGVDVEHAVRHLKNPENVRRVSMDMCDPYKRFARDYFPGAQIVADKFHVLRLPNAALMKYRKEAERGKNTAYLRNILLKPGYQVLDYWRPRLKEWLKKYPALEEVYWAKERLSRFYRMRSVAQAAKELTRLTDSLTLSSVPEIRRLRATLKKWRIAILNRSGQKSTEVDEPGEAGHRRCASQLLDKQTDQRPRRGLQHEGQTRQTTSLRLYLVFELQTQTAKCLRHLAFSERPTMECGEPSFF